MNWMHPKAMKQLENGGSVSTDLVLKELRELRGSIGQLELRLLHFTERTEYRVAGLEADVFKLMPHKTMEEIGRQERSKPQG